MFRNPLPTPGGTPLSFAALLRGRMRNGDFAVLGGSEFRRGQALAPMMLEGDGGVAQGMSGDAAR